jgi:Serine/threonine protein phosphatase
MRLNCIYYTNTGKVRAKNEDAMLIVDEIFSEEDFQQCLQKSKEGTEFVFVVADGMGGHEKGEVASKLVLETILESKDRLYTDIEDVLLLAKKRLDEYVKNNPFAYNMGCALAGLVIREGLAKVFNVGDCRVYRFINDNLVKLTKDHSVVEKLILEGLISEEEAKHHPKRNVLTSAILGDLSDVIPEVYVTEVELFEEDVFFLCSDGVWGELEKEEIKECLSKEKPCESLLDVLKTKPLKDNLSFAILKVEGG